MERKNMWKEYSPEQLDALEKLSVRYRQCLDAAKTERECVNLTREMAKEQGYQDLNKLVQDGTVLKAGDKVYAECMGKTIVLFQIGKEPLEKGMNILGAHVDSPRLDVKQNPLYEESDLAYLDTHYYGGIKKYQWVTVPLALHGVFAKKDGTVQEITIGEKADDPVFVISDLLIHISQEQLEKKASVVIEGEGLDLLIGSKPALRDSEEEKDAKESVKKMVLAYLEKEYGVEEEDFLSAELEIVPAGPARDCGLDRSMILGYGHDDRVCAFPSLFAMFETEMPNRTTCCILVDKEEVNSQGATGMHSRFFENAVAELVALTDGESAIKTRRALQNSCMLSSDVSAAFDPLYASAFEKKNSAYFGRGIVLNKYTGSRGKVAASDANAEYIAKVRKVFDNNGVGFQTAEMGRIDLGGGGTIAYIMANYGMEVIDSGVAVLSMHAPWEVISKADLYETYKAYKAFLAEMC